MSIRYTVRIPRDKNKKKSTKKKKVEEQQSSTDNDFINQPYPQPPKKHLPVVDDREEVKVELETKTGIPILDDKTREALSGEYAKLRMLPRQTCNGCHLSTDCPEFKEDYVCAFEKALQAFPVRDVDSVVAILTESFQNNVERARFARIQERIVEGGQANDRVTRLNDVIFSQGERLIDLTRSTQRATVTLSGPRGADPTASSGGVLSRLFGGAPKGSAENMLLQGPPNVIDEIREDAADEIVVGRREVIEMEEDEDAEGAESVPDSAE